MRKVLVAQAADIERELYLRDRARPQPKLPLVMLSAEGGVEIEEVARTAPEKIVQHSRAARGPARSYQARALFQPLLQDGALVAQAADILLKLWRVLSGRRLLAAPRSTRSPITPEGQRRSRSTPR